MRTSPFPVPRLVVLTAFAFAAVLCGTARGATFVVNSTLDAGDTAPGNGVCDDGAGHCTLRAAIEETNSADPT
jgi:CSLREA domain-containing protein